MNEIDPQGTDKKLIELANAEDIASYINGGKKILALFEMTGCPFCLNFQSAFLDFAEKHSEDCTILRVLLDDPGNPLWEKYDIIAVPTVIAFSGGEIVARVDSILGVGLSKKMWINFCAEI